MIWANVVASADGRDRPARSSWTRGGEPLPFVPYDDSWMPDHHHGETAFRGLYKQSLRTYASHVPAAVIPVEDIGGHVLLMAGGDDRVWPSLLFAEHIRKRRKSAGRSTIMVTGEAAGHRVPFPGEAQPAGGMTMARGGTEKEDRALGRCSIRRSICDVRGLPQLPRCERAPRVRTPIGAGDTLSRGGCERSWPLRPAS